METIDADSCRQQKKYIILQAVLIQKWTNGLVDVLMWDAGATGNGWLEHALFYSWKINVCSFVCKIF